MGCPELDLCEHVWVANTKSDGSLDFRMNRQLSGEPLVIVKCELCKARTWMTREQWDTLPNVEDKSDE